MRFAIPRTVLFCLLFGGIAKPLSAEAKPDFDDLSRRAAAALKKQPAEAARLYRQAVGLKPGWAEGWFYLGASLYQGGEYKDARDAFARAATLAPANGASWGFLGLAEEQLKQYPAALAHLLKGEAQGLPDNLGFVSTVHIRAASIYARVGEFSRAVQQLEPLARAGDQSAAVIGALGVSALTLPYEFGSVPEAKRPVVDLAGRAMWALYANRDDEAGKLFQDLLAKYPAERGVHYICGIYNLNRDAQAALREFRKELETNPTHVFARVQIAMVSINSGAPESALEPAREAVRLAPDNFLCHVTLGRALLDTKQAGDAIREFEAAIRLAPDYPHAHFYLGQAYRMAGRSAESHKEIAEFTRLKSLQNQGSSDDAPPGTP